MRISNGIKMGKNVPQEYGELIYNGCVKDEDGAYDLQIWAEMNGIDLDEY